MSNEYATRHLPVVVIGAGPVGLAAAAHLAGHRVPSVVLEAGDTVGAAIRNWQHVRLFSRWRDNIDPVAGRLLDTAGWPVPDPQRYPTGAELIDDYLLPLAGLPALADRIRYGARVTGIARLGIDRLAGADQLTGTDRADTPFVVRLDDGTEQLARAVIDASGTWHTPNHLGGEGLPALGESAAAAYLDFALPDVLGTDRSAHAGRHTVVVGAGHSAANSLLDLIDLAGAVPGTRITWAVRRVGADPVFAADDADALPARGAIGTGLRRLVDTGRVTLAAGFVTHRVERCTAAGPVRLVSRDGRSIVADRVVVATGFRADHRLAAELRLDVDPVLGTSRGLAALLDADRPRGGPAPAHSVAELRHPEPGYFVVGVKSYGRSTGFLMATGYRQVRQVTAALAAGPAVDRRRSASHPLRWPPVWPRRAATATGHAGRSVVNLSRR
ncbi:FAD-dependent oxidoreductase [Solwaraspora sp. WMMA2101]|uniref:FAD-dependent oxidoreductase n=1 Tax=Solwaraspora sp. WMMA2101 TaxID=3404124 RepID=UPI003B93B992